MPYSDRRRAWNSLEAHGFTASGPGQTLPDHKNSNLLTDDDLWGLADHLELQPEGGPLALSTEMVIEILANHYELNTADCLANFQSTEPDPATDCLLQDPFAEAAWGSISVRP